MTGNPLKYVHISGLHGQQEVSVALRPGLNLIYGRNGSGKTTFLHILANLADRDLERFCHLRFDQIAVETRQADRLVLTQSRAEDGGRVTLSLNGVPFGSVARGENTPPNIRDALRTCLGGRPVYLPAFRAILEAITESRAQRQYGAEPGREAEVKRIVDHLQTERSDERSARARRLIYASPRGDSQGVAYKTALCRDWFGAFVPIVRFPSLAEVAEQLSVEFQEAQFEVATTDREAFSDVFIKVLQSVFSGSTDAAVRDIEPILGSIRESLEGLQEASSEVPHVYYQISSLVKEHSQHPTLKETIASKILLVYEQALRERINVQRRAFQRIKTFEESVNRFLQHKQLAVDATGGAHVGRAGRARMIVLEGGRKTSLSVLSSGERHVLALLFSATHMSSADGMLLIDEPELSLHVDWQRVILRELMKQAGDRQIIACTHAPEVTADHRNVMTRLGTKYLDREGPIDEDIHEIEL